MNLLLEIKRMKQRKQKKVAVYVFLRIYKADDYAKSKGDTSVNTQTKILAVSYPKLTPTASIHARLESLESVAIAPTASVNKSPTYL